METVEYKGKIYEVGKYYLFGDTKDDISCCIKLESINSTGYFPFGAIGLEWKYIKQMPSSDSFGTITDAPVELVDGSIYIFDGLTVKQTGVGFYNKENDIFTPTSGDKEGIPVEYCSNIRKMGVIE